MCLIRANNIKTNSVIVGDKRKLEKTKTLKFQKVFGEIVSADFFG